MLTIIAANINSLTVYSGYSLRIVESIVQWISSLLAQVCSPPTHLCPLQHLRRGLIPRARLSVAVASVAVSLRIDSLAATPPSLRQWISSSSVPSVFMEIPHAWKDFWTISAGSASQHSFTHWRHNALLGACTLPSAVYVFGPVAIH